MARTATTKTSTASVASEKNTEVTAIAEGVKNKEEEIIKKEVKRERLSDRDEVAVESLIANVSYKDSKTGDYYEWPSVGHVEYMTMDVIKNMWRNHKGYFRDMILRPLDERVIDELGLKRTYEKYEKLTDPSIYTRDNIDSVIKEIDAAPDTFKSGMIRRFFVFVSDGDISDIQVLRKIEKHYDVDLISLL